jgi:hypothetical protein
MCAQEWLPVERHAERVSLGAQYGVVGLATEVNR